MLYYIFFISLETFVLRNRAGSNVQLFNKPKERKQKSNKRVLKQKRSHCEMSGDAFLDAIASVGLHMSVCLLVSLFDDGTYISKGICMQHMVQKSASDNGTCCHEYCHKSCHE